MDYGRIYGALIEKANNREILGYHEKHHIIPKCIGGTNNKDNIVKLTAREHYIAHQLLVKLYPSNKNLIYAVRAMTISNAGQVRNNKEYSWLRIKHAKAMSELHANKIVTIVTKNKMSIKAKARGNNGWDKKKHTKESRIKMSDSARARGSNCTGRVYLDNTLSKMSDSASSLWEIQFPDNSINTIKNLKDFAIKLGTTVYKLKANKCDGYIILNKMRGV